MSWIPLMTMEENIITAAPPRTGCGMIDTRAPSFGNRPQRIRKTAPVARAKRLTTLVIVTRPTFWLKEVFARTPKSAAKDDPRPSQITPPDNSESVASRPRPPSITPEISPTVSTAVTMNMIITGTIARASNEIFTGIRDGTANQLACATLSKFSTQAFVYSTPSALIAVVGRTCPIMNATMYPAMIPIRIAEELAKPLFFSPCLQIRITASTKSASSIFSIEPKSAALFPPPKELIPTEIKDSPMDNTTVPVTTDGKNLRSGFKKSPRTPSNKPPMIEAPMIAPYAATPPPMVAATLLNTPMKPELVPMMIGTFPPIGPMA